MVRKETIYNILIITACVCCFASLSEARKIVCVPNYNPQTKTCSDIYCHSDGKGNARSIAWGTNSRVICELCHGYPPVNANHQNITPQTGCQTCHPDTIANGHTTSFHIDGFVSAYPVDNIDDTIVEEGCIVCHREPQNEWRAIVPEFELLSHHIKGQIDSKGCAVCHLEAEEKYHGNKKIDLKNHQGGLSFDSAQYDEFCLSCHGVGESQLYGPIPFNDNQPIISIQNELIYRESGYSNTTNFWYPHNHSPLTSESRRLRIALIQGPMTGKEASPIMMPGTVLSPGGAGSIVPTSPTIIAPLVGGSAIIPGQTIISPLVGGAGIIPGQTIISPLAGGAGMIPGQTIISPPAGGAGMIPGLTIITPGTTGIMLGNQAGGAAPASIAPPGAMGSMPTQAIIPSTITPALPGNMGQQTITSPGTGTMGPANPGGSAFSPALTAPFGMPIYTGNNILSSMVSMTPGVSNRLSPTLTMLPVNMGNPFSPAIGNPFLSNGIGNQMMGQAAAPMWSAPTPSYPSLMNNTMMPAYQPSSMQQYNQNFQMPSLGITTPQASHGQNQQQTGMGNNSVISNNSMTFTPPPPAGHSLSPQQQNMGNNQVTIDNKTMEFNTPPPPGYKEGEHMETEPAHENNNYPTDEQAQNSQINCTNCHIYSDPEMIPYAQINLNYNGHYSHTSCAQCHMPHGSYQPKLIRAGIVWDPLSRSCNVDTCHPNFMHQAPLNSTGILYEVLPNSICNTSSCHAQ